MYCHHFVLPKFPQVKFDCLGKEIDQDSENRADSKLFQRQKTGHYSENVMAQPFEICLQNNQ